MSSKILIVDDEKPTRDVIAKFLGRKYDCLTAADTDDALRLLSVNEDITLMISDIRMPGRDGMELFRTARKSNPALMCILVTAFGRVDQAVEAMREGAYDFLMKPVDLEQLELRVSKALRAAALEKEVSDLKTQLSGEIENFTGKSPAMEKVYRLIRKVAPTNATVLVEGPSGTGKELVARAIHNLSPRAKGPFVAVECAALSKELLASELFGYAPGTFTGGLKDGKAGCFETANGGTLFLDEIGEIDPDTQVKLLRAIESRTVVRMGSSQAIPVDFRLVAATNKNLIELVADGRFREDLYYRLNVIDIRTPALKDHREDIALLVSRFLKEFSAANGGSVTGIEPAALKALEDYAWPGNVRQLRNVIEKMVVLSSGSKLTTDDLPIEVTEFQGFKVSKSSPLKPCNLATLKPCNPATLQPGNPETLKPSNLATNEKDLILSVLAKCGNNKSKAADELGISRRTIHRKLKDWGLS